MCLHRCSDKRKCRGFFSRTAFAMYRRLHLPKADKRCGSCAHRVTGESLEISPVNNSGYFHQLDLPENVSYRINSKDLEHYCENRSNIGKISENIFSQKKKNSARFPLTLLVSQEELACHYNKILPGNQIEHPCICRSERNYRCDWSSRYQTLPARDCCRSIYHSPPLPVSYGRQQPR